MAERLSEVQTGLQTLHELQEIVGDRRAMAAVRVQEAQVALPAPAHMPRWSAKRSPRRCRCSPRCRRRPSQRGGAATRLVLFMAEHGFSGAFNDELIAAAGQAMRGGEALFVIGSRGRALIEERSVAPACRPIWRSTPPP